MLQRKCDILRIPIRVICLCFDHLHDAEGLQEKLSGPIHQVQLCGTRTPGLAQLVLYSQSLGNKKAFRHFVVVRMWYLQ